MATLYRYRIRCVTEVIDKFVWLDSASPAPTQCPTNTAHTVDLTSVAVVEQVAHEQVDVVNNPMVYPRRAPNLSRSYVFSVDFTKRKTWHVDAVKVADEAVGIGTGVQTVFQLAFGTGAGIGHENEAILDLSHGLVTDENLLAPQGGIIGDYLPVVKVAGVTKTEREAYESSGGDYWIDYNTGAITFYTAPVNLAAVTVTYWYVPATAGPKLILPRPVSGKKVSYDTAEAQFSKDIGYTDTIVQLPVYDGSVGVPPRGTPVAGVPVTELRHIGNVYDYTFGSFPEIPALSSATSRGLTQPTQVLRWDLGSPIVMLGSQPIEIWTYTKHQRAFTGERGTLTFYGLEEDE